MEPTLKNGSEVLASSIPYIFSEPKVGDIVAFKKDDKVFIKRIKKRKDDNYYLMGDNEKDSLKIGWISKKDIIGKVIGTL